jgi:hypothetical protein
VLGTPWIAASLAVTMQGIGATNKGVSLIDAWVRASLAAPLAVTLSLTGVSEI